MKYGAATIIGAGAVAGAAAGAIYGAATQKSCEAQQGLFGFTCSPAARALAGTPIGITLAGAAAAIAHPAKAKPGLIAIGVGLLAMVVGQIRIAHAAPAGASMPRG